MLKKDEERLVEGVAAAILRRSCPRPDWDELRVLCRCFAGPVIEAGAIDRVAAEVERRIALVEPPSVA